MTNEEKSIAIVTLCPSVFVRPTGQSGWNYRNSVVGRVLPCIDGEPQKDMNAMHEAWNTLTDDQKVTFAKKLGNNPKFCQLRKNYVVTRLHLLLGASAEDYTDAFLLTHGLTL